MADAVAAPYSGTTTQVTQQTQPTQTSRMNEMGKDAFLKLLTVQLSNQDPLSPMSNEDFIAQMAQLQTLEQTIAMTKSFESFGRNQELGAASALIGKTVRAVVQADGASEAEEITGPVSSVRLSDGEVALVVNGQEVTLDQILEVTNTNSNSPNNTDNGTSGGDVVDFFLPPA